MTATTAPVQPWDPIIEALRDELEEYGGLMQLFDEQQARIFARDGEAVAGLVPQLEQQAAAARARRAVRERTVRTFATTRGRTTDCSLRQLLPDFPDHVQPLLEALIDEINQLVHRARRRTRQNQMLLARLVELHQQLLPTIHPQSFTKTYSRRGQLAVAATIGPAYRAVG